MSEARFGSYLSLKKIVHIKICKDVAYDKCNTFGNHFVWYF